MRCSAEPNCGHPSQQQPELGATARSLYVEWHVIPLLPGTKRPACPGHPAAKCDRSDPWCRHGHTGWEQRATTSDPRIIRAWSSPVRTRHDRPGQHRQRVATARPSERGPGQIVP
jgi:hypothetical protein